MNSFCRYVQQQTLSEEDTSPAVTVHSLHNVVYTSNVTGRDRGPKRKRHLFAGTWRPLVSVITTLLRCAYYCRRRVWYRALSLRYACIRSSSIILIP